MKKAIPVLAALLAALLLAACGGTPSSAASAAPPVSQAPAEPADQGGTIAGTVVDATMNTVTIQVPNGSEYSFATEGAEISSPEGLLIDDQVTIRYTGVFDDTKQMQEVVVTSVEVAADGRTPASTPQAPAPVEDVKSLEGTIDQYDGDTMMVVDATGVDFLFPLAGADLHVGEEGFQVGDMVVVYYYGELVDMPEVQNVTVGEVKKAD